jgi:hypothetical protein
MAHLQQASESLNAQLAGTNQQQIAHNPSHHAPQKGVSDEIHVNKAALPPATRPDHPANSAPPGSILSLRTGS